MFKHCTQLDVSGDFFSLSSKLNINKSTRYRYMLVIFYCLGFLISWLLIINNFIHSSTVVAQDVREYGRDTELFDSLSTSFSIERSPNNLLELTPDHTSVEILFSKINNPLLISIVALSFLLVINITATFILVQRAFRLNRAIIMESNNLIKDFMIECWHCPLRNTFNTKTT